jgi:hypothetical protein
VYLLHFDRPYRHARHYLGWCRAGRLDERLAEHRAGRGARLMAVIKDAGIGFELARTWPGPRALERRLKNCHNTPRKCPLCGVTPRLMRRPILAGLLQVASAALALEPPY